MGLMDRLKKAIQPDDNDYDGSPDEMYDYDDDPILNNNIPNANNIYSQNNNQNYNQNYNQNDYGAQNSGINQPSNISVGGAVSSPVSLKLVKPKKFGNGAQIANDLLNKKTIIMLLDETESKETARRLVDFMTGVAYAIDGQIKTVNSTMIIIAPSDVDISGMNFNSESMKKSSSDDIFD